MTEKSHDEIFDERFDAASAFRDAVDRFAEAPSPAHLQQLRGAATRYRFAFLAAAAAGMEEDPDLKTERDAVKKARAESRAAVAAGRAERRRPSPPRADPPGEREIPFEHDQGLDTLPTGAEQVGEVVEPGDDSPALIAEHGDADADGNPIPAGTPIFESDDEPGALGEVEPTFDEPVDDEPSESHAAPAEPEPEQDGDGDGDGDGDAEPSDEGDEGDDASQASDEQDSDGDAAPTEKPAKKSKKSGEG